MKELKDLTGSVTPDDAVGRISRIDAINNNSIAEASIRNIENRLDQLSMAIRMTEEANFGICIQCHQSIPFDRFWVESLKITNAAFGTMYATVTIISAFLISAVGKYIDRISLRNYGLLVFSGLMVSVVVLSQAYHTIILMLGLFMVRWFGQGLMTHTSSTGIAKHFDEHRGKALGVTALGRPAGQFILPLLVVPLIAFAGWRYSLLYLAVSATYWAVPLKQQFRLKFMEAEIWAKSEVISALYSY